LRVKKKKSGRHPTLPWIFGNEVDISLYSNIHPPFKIIFKSPNFFFAPMCVHIFSQNGYHRPSASPSLFLIKQPFSHKRDQIIYINKINQPKNIFCKERRSFEFPIVSGNTSDRDRNISSSTLIKNSFFFFKSFSFSFVPYKHFS
jgi:alpha-N-acetylglucosamine transferase